MAVSGYLSAELAATCNALGFYDGQKYHLEPHCKETVRDLIRYLRRDEGGSHEIRRYLGNAKLLTTDLLPMVQCHHKDVQLFDIALRLIVNLTNPALLVYNEVIPTDKFEHNYYLEIVSHLQQYKEAFNDTKAWAPFTERLSELLGKKVDDRSEDDQRTVERILILIRNILHVPSSTDLDQRPDNDASIHDQVLWGLHQSGMIDLLLYVSSSDQESLFFMHLLEIICLMLREQPADVLAKTASQRSAEEKNKDDEELLKIRQLELQNKMNKNKKYFGTRHSNFGGTFVIKNMKSTSDNNDLIYHKPVHDSKYISLDTEKKPVKLPKNRQPLKCESAERKSALSVRLILKQVCVEFLNAAYNPLMLHVRECFHRGRAQENDESYYFMALRFFMEFNRHYNFQVKYVSETLSVQTFQFIQKYLETWHDMMTTDKKKLPLWSYRSHLALRAYKELLHNLAVMDRNDDDSVRESSKVIKSNIFYVLEYREMLLMLVNVYKREKYSKKYLVDLLETLHVFIKLLCDYCKDKRMVIQKTATRRKKKNKQKKSKSQAPDQASVETIWNLACDEVAVTLTSNIECDVVPFDATLELDMDQQKLEAIKKIQFHLKNGDNKQAVAMLRASREVWPENDTFGASLADTAEELEILRDIFLADLGNNNPAAALTEEHADGSEDEEEEDHYPQILEQNFEVKDFLKRFASPKVVRICNTLLSTYDTNSETTNHCIVRMLHRIAWECKIPAMLFQASLFIKFRNILSNYEPKYKELAKLAVYILRKFTEVAATNKTVFVELLFPKHVKDACEIVDGYGTYQDSKNKRVAWEEHEEEELRRLDEEYSRTNVKERNIAKKKPPGPVWMAATPENVKRVRAAVVQSPGRSACQQAQALQIKQSSVRLIIKNKVDWILDNLINKDRSRIGLIKKMKELGLEVPQTKPKGFWEAEAEEELKKLHEEADKDLPDKLLVSWIHERMTSKEHTERSIKKKMYELGLLQPPVKKLKHWSPEQDEELTELFEEYKNSVDVMGPILSTLGSVRSRQNIVVALLRLGLINDKSELKKKSNKSRKSKSNQESQSDADSDDEESGDDESDDEGGQRSTRNELDKPPPPGTSTATVFRELSKTKYLQGGLKWLIGALNDNLEDLDADVYDADVPLLPLSEEPVLSMENPIFHNFLQALGFKKPIPNQEVYWRAAAHWKEIDIRTRIEVLKCMLDNVGKELDDFSDDLNNKLAAAVGESVDVLEGGRDSNMIGSPVHYTEDFNAIVQKECQRVLSKERKSGVSGSKSKKPRMQDFLMEQNAGSDDELGGRSLGGRRDGSVSSEDDAPKSGGFGKVASRRRFSIESDADDPVTPKQNGAEGAVLRNSSPGRTIEVDRNSDTENGQSPVTNITPKNGADESDDDSMMGRGRLKTTRKSILDSDSETEASRSFQSGKKQSNEEILSKVNSTKRKLSPNSSDSEVPSVARKKRNILESDEEEEETSSSVDTFPVLPSTSCPPSKLEQTQPNSSDEGQLSQDEAVLGRRNAINSDSGDKAGPMNGSVQDGHQALSHQSRSDENGCVQKATKKRTALNSDSEDDSNNDLEQNVAHDSAEFQKSVRRKKTARIIDSDDE